MSQDRLTHFELGKNHVTRVLTFTVVRPDRPEIEMWQTFHLFSIKSTCKRRIIAQLIIAFF